MEVIEFFEKPGCATNLKQVASLRAAGCVVNTHSLLAEPWTAETLLAFLAPLPSASWFNRAAPRIKQGEIKPEALNRDEALNALLAEHLLIRRPLLRIGEHQLVGFDAAAIAAALGCALPGLTDTPQGCSHVAYEPPCDGGAP